MREPTESDPAVVYFAENLAGTEKLGRILGASLPEGSLIALIGTLGAGKTRLVQAVAESLGHPINTVSSPTFVLIHQYEEGEVPIYHFDAYRLENDEEFRKLGPDEYFEAGGLSFLEWADRVEGALPEDRLEIRIEPTSENGRKFEISALGRSYEKVLAALAERIKRES